MQKMANMFSGITPFRRLYTPFNKIHSGKGLLCREQVLPGFRFIMAGRQDG
jgi:hypothetical protein